MKSRKFISLTCAILLLICCSAPASAASFNGADNTCTPNATGKVVHVLNGMTRSLSVPTVFWNLTVEDYSAVLQQVGRSMLYTNYYFKANSSGTLYVDYDVVAQGAATFRIGVYNVDTGLVVTDTDVSVGGNGKVDTATFSNLSTTANYAIFFMSVYDGWSVVYLSGSAEIHH